MSSAISRLPSLVSFILKENPRSEQAIDKLLELFNRIPYHYEWRKSQGGAWVRKKLPFTPFAEINTSYEGEWKAEVARVAAQLFGEKLTHSETFGNHRLRKRSASHLKI